MNDFLANIYEVWGQNYLGGFSDDLYELGIYIPVFLWSFGITVFSLFTYYKIFDQPRFSKVIIWVCFIALISLISGFIAYTIADTAIYNLYADMGQDIPYYQADYMSFAITNTILFLIISFLLSILIKFISINHKYIPF